MFFVHEMEERIPLHPSYFSSEAPDSIRELLYKKKEGTNTGTMMIVRIIGILEISEPKVMPGTGMAMYTISYRAVVWQPFRGEVVDGEVSQVVNNGFFVDVGALSVFVSKAVSLRWNKNPRR
jgi:DNA-directed RNA polymerase II subunit RPB7